MGKLVVMIVLVLGGIGGLGGRAEAQIVNIQNLLAKPPDANGASGSLEVKLEWRGGNNRFFDVGGAGSVLVKHDRLLGLAVVRGEYGSANGDTDIAKKTFEHLRARVTLDCRWRWEVFAQHEYDAFRRLAVRAVAGTGPALQIVNEKEVKLLAGAAYLFEAEQLSSTPMDASDAGDRSVASRASVYVTGTEQVRDGVEITQTVYAQPRITDPGDVRVLGELAAAAKLSKRFALVEELSAAYDRTPPVGIKRYDTALKFGVAVSF